MWNVKKTAPHCVICEGGRYCGNERVNSVYVVYTENCPSLCDKYVVGYLGNERVNPLCVVCTQKCPSFCDVKLVCTENCPSLCDK